MKILIITPAYNEAKILEQNVLKLVQFVRANFFGQEYKIVISDNNSQDQTAVIAKSLMEKYPELDYIFVPEQGKGYAISQPWLLYLNQFDVFIFLDADLATDLSALPKLIAGISAGYDLVIGSRYLKESEVKKSLGRQIFSLGYRLILKLVLGTKIKDLPCGFKAANQKIIKNIVPQIKNHTWFFDSEMVYLAERAGYKIKEIPVKWAEPRTVDDKSRVSLLKVSLLYLKEIIKLKFRKI